MPGHGDERSRRLKPQELVDPRRVEWKIEARAYADLQYAALGSGHHSLAIWHEMAVSHRQIDEMRQYAIRVESHGLLPSPVPRARHRASPTIERSSWHGLAFSPSKQVLQPIPEAPF